MSPADLDLLAELARARCGQALRGDRAYFVESRLAPLARRMSAASVAALVERYRASHDEPLARAMVEALCVPETAFFRDPLAWRTLAEQVLPRLSLRRGGQNLRIWSAGCSTGQEAYSIAMLLSGEPVGRIAEARPPVSATVLASDLSERALEKAHAGVYTQFEVQRGLPIRAMLRWFEKAGEMWRVSPDLRQTVRWGRLNLMDDVSRIGRPDLILCRNVLGGMHPEARFSVLERLGGLLAEDGVLMVGAAETVELAGFDPLRAGTGLFQKNPAYARAAAA